MFNEPERFFWLRELEGELEMCLWAMTSVLNSCPWLWVARGTAFIEIWFIELLIDWWGKKSVYNQKNDAQTHTIQGRSVVPIILPKWEHLLPKYILHIIWFPNILFCWHTHLPISRIHLPISWISIMAVPNEYVDQIATKEMPIPQANCRIQTIIIQRLYFIF